LPFHVAVALTVLETGSSMYTKFFALREKPFASSPDPAYFFPSTTHQNALNMLLEGVSGETGIVLLTGDTGAGKTTIGRRLLTVVPTGSETVSILDTRLTPLELVAAICDQLRIDYDAARDTIPQLLAALNSHLVNLQTSNRCCVVLIDDAERLTIETLLQLRALYDLDARRSRVLHLVLIGESALQRTLARPDLLSLAKIIGSHAQLAPLSEEEIGPYVLHRLEIAGAGQQYFNDEALLALYEVSHGLPARINQISDRALLAAFAEERRLLTAELVRWAARQTTAATPPPPAKPRPLPQTTKKNILPWLAGLAGIAAVALIWQLVPSPPAPRPPAAPVSRPTPPPPPAPADVSPPPTEPAAPPSPLAWPQDRDLGLSQQDAFKSLFARWQLEWLGDEQEAPCDFALRHGLVCGMQQGNWSGLIALNRPVVLELRVGAQAYWATLLKIEEEQATVSLAATTRQVAATEVEQRWSGRFFLVREPD